MSRIKDTVDIIKLIPIEKSVKDDLLSRYPDRMSGAEKRAIDEVMWDIYEKYFEIELDKNISVEMEKIKNKKGNEGNLVELDINFKSVIAGRTHESMPQVLAKLADEQEMENIRATIK